MERNAWERRLIQVRPGSGSSTFEMTEMLNNLVEPDHRETAALLTYPNIMEKNHPMGNIFKISLMFMERAIPAKL